jgi:hypothetical protein
MYWDALGAVAEISGAIVVFVTLIYFAIQTRENVKVLRARANWDAQVSFVEVNDVLGDGGTVSELIFRSLSESEDFSDYEKYLVHRFARGWFQRMEAQFALYKAGILDEEVWRLRCGYAAAILANPLFRDSWELDKTNSMFTRAFIESIDVNNEKEISGFLGIGPIRGS